MQAIPDRLSDPAAATIARAILARHAGDGPLESWISKVLLAAYGVPVSRERMVQSRIAAIEAAMEEIGFPCVLEQSGALADAAAVGAAYDEISRLAGFVGAWLREAVPEGTRTQVRLVLTPGSHRIDCDAVARPMLAAMLARLSELAHDLREEIALIEIDPIILLPDRIVVLGASITPRRGTP
jgi:hypothetical protein